MHFTYLYFFYFIIFDKKERKIDFIMYNGVNRKINVFFFLFGLILPLHHLCRNLPLSTVFVKRIAKNI